MRMHRIVRPAVIAAAAVTLWRWRAATAPARARTSSGGRRFPGAAAQRRRFDLRRAAVSVVVPVLPPEGAGRPDQLSGDRSGGGIEQFTAKTVDFGATDVPLQSDEIGNLPNKNYIEFPTALGAVVFAYNLQGVDSGLKLDGKTIADIFLGNITIVERPGDHRPEPRREPPGRADPDGAPFRRVGNDGRVDVVALGRELRVVVEGRRRQGRPVAGRHRRRTATTASRPASRRPRGVRATCPTTSR